MSRTKIISIMENNNKHNPALFGLDANSGNDGTCFEFLFNKSLGNGKQYNSVYDLNLISELTGSLINNVNNIDSLNFVNKTEDNTYTLDDLLDLAAVVPENAPEDVYNFDGAFDLLSGEPQNLCTEFVMDTALASPLSASSEESCDLDELLFQDENLTELQLPTTNGNTALTTEVLDSSDGSEQFQSALQNVLIDESYFSAAEEPSLTEESTDVLTQLGFEEAAVAPDQNQVQFNEADLSALCSMLFQQNQGMAVPEQQEQSPSVVDSEPSSPSSSSSSESGSDEIRFKPYSKSKKKTPEQRQRKKAQNRTAASRYRVKKKDELQTISVEADELEEKNKKLRGKVDGLRTEIDYLKNLMLDVIKARLAKGTLPSNLLSVVLDK